MKKALLSALALGALVAGATTANAAQGCGAGFHRGPHGRCLPNGGPGYGPRPGALVIGTFYPGHGYWDGHRYWAHRDRWHGGWRYR